MKIKLTLKFRDEKDAAEFFEANKYRLQVAGLKHCTIIEHGVTDAGKIDIVCMLVGDDPCFEADQDHIDWAQSDPAPWWTFQR